MHRTELSEVRLSTNVARRVMPTHAIAKTCVTAANFRPSLKRRQREIYRHISLQQLGKNPIAKAEYLCFVVSQWKLFGVISNLLSKKRLLNSPDGAFGWLAGMKGVPAEHRKRRRIVPARRKVLLCKPKKPGIRPHVPASV